MAIMMEPVAPWLRAISRLFTSDAAPTPFVPPADVIVSDEGVTVVMDVPGLRSENLEIALENDTPSVRGERSHPYAGAGVAGDHPGLSECMSWARFRGREPVPADHRVCVPL